MLILAVPEQPPLFGAERPLFIFPLKKASEQAVENLRPDLPLAKRISSLLHRQEISRKKHFVRPRPLQPLLPLAYVIYAVENFCSRAWAIRFRFHLEESVLLLKFKDNHEETVELTEIMKPRGIRLGNILRTWFIGS